MRYLSDYHRKILHEDGISDEVIDAAGLFTCTEPDQIQEFGYSLGQLGIGFPYSDLEGNYTGFRMRKDNPDDSGKYHQKSQAGFNLYFLRLHSRKIEEAKTVMLVEGEKKALAAISKIGIDSSVCVMAYPGCYNFRSKIEEGVAEIYKKISWSKKEVLNIPDSDFYTNKQVFDAGTELAKFLFDNQADISLIDIRSKKINGKVGLDDFLIHHGLDELRRRVMNPFWKFYSSSLSKLDENSNSAEIGKVLASFVLEKDPIAKSDILNEIKLKTHKNLGDLKKLLDSQTKKYFSHRPSLKAQPNQIFYNEKVDSIPVIVKKIHELTHQNDRIYLDPNGNQIIFHQQESDIFRYIGSASEYSSNLGKIFDFCHVGYVKDSGLEIMKRGHIPDKMISTLISNPKEFGAYREVEFFSTAPVYTSNGLIKEPGFNQENKIHINMNSFKEANGLKNLTKLLDSFAFRDNASRSNAAGLILSQVMCLNYFKGTHPAGIMKADDRNLGKTTFAQAACIVANGKKADALSLPDDPAEMEKLIASYVKSENVVLFDNITPKDGRTLALPVLERILTADSIVARMLGHNEVIKRSNNVQFYLTLNEGRFSYDMILRSVIVEFSLENAGKIDTSFDVLHFCLESRMELIAELVFMVENWIAKGSPKANVKFPKFPSWGMILGGILESNGFSDFLGNNDNIMARLDPIVETIFQISINQITLTGGETSQYLSASNWVAKILPYPNVFNPKDSEQTKATVVGSTLSRLEAKVIKFDYLGKEYRVSVLKRNSSAGGNNKEYAVTAVPLSSLSTSYEKDKMNINDKNNFSSSLSEQGGGTGVTTLTSNHEEDFW